MLRKCNASYFLLVSLMEIRLLLETSLFLFQMGKKSNGRQGGNMNQSLSKSMCQKSGSLGDQLSEEDRAEYEEWLNRLRQVAHEGTE